MLTQNKNEVLNELLAEAQFFIKNAKMLNKATLFALKKLTDRLSSSLNVNEVFSIYNNVSKIHIEALDIINNIVEKFPLECTIQERQLLEAFRKMSECQKIVVLQALNNMENNSEAE